jgi:hypothetical protein
LASNFSKNIVDRSVPTCLFYISYWILDSSGRY